MKTFTAKAAQSQKNWLLVHAGDHLHSVCHLRWLRLQPGPQLMQQCCLHLQTHYASNWRWYGGRKGKSFLFSHGDHVQGSQHHSSSHSLPGSTEALSFSLCMPRLRVRCSHSPGNDWLDVLLHRHVQQCTISIAGNSNQAKEL
jgi:hypothetical protein